MSDFGAKSTADEVLAGHELSGRTAFVTGGYSGLGKETARAMAAKGAHVILCGRDAGKLAEAAGEIDGKVDTIVCDLGSLESVRACGKEARERFEKINLLINNAGVMACPQGETADGFETQFGTNHLGHFALPAELMPLLEKGDAVRIVNLSSRGHHFAPVDLDDPNFEHRDYDKWASYGQSKTANVLFSVGLEQRFGDRGIYAVHPGGIVTNLGRHLTEEDVARLRARIGDQDDANSRWKSIPQGAATTCWAATADELEGKGGVYCEDCHVAPVDDDNPEEGVRGYAVDTGNADKLWALSEQATGASYPG